MSTYVSSDLQAHLNEYHNTVSEVIGGISTDLIETKNEIKELKKQYKLLEEEVKEIKKINHFLIKESLKKTSDSNK